MLPPPKEMLTNPPEPGTAWKTSSPLEPPLLLVVLAGAGGLSATAVAATIAETATNKWNLGRIALTTTTILSLMFKFTEEISSL